VLVMKTETTLCLGSTFLLSSHLSVIPYILIPCMILSLTIRNSEQTLFRLAKHVFIRISFCEIHPSYGHNLYICNTMNNCMITTQLFLCNAGAGDCDDGDGADGDDYDDDDDDDESRGR